LIVRFSCLQIVVESLLEVAICMIDFTQDEENVTSDILNLYSEVWVLFESLFGTAVCIQDLKCMLTNHLRHLVILLIEVMIGNDLQG